MFVTLQPACSKWYKYIPLAATQKHKAQQLTAFSHLVFYKEEKCTLWDSLKHPDRNTSMLPFLSLYKWKHYKAAEKSSLGTNTHILCDSPLNFNGSHGFIGKITFVVDLNCLTDEVETQVEILFPLKLQQTADRANNMSHLHKRIRDIIWINIAT